MEADALAGDVKGVAVDDAGRAGDVGQGGRGHEQHGEDDGLELSRGRAHLSGTDRRAIPAEKRVILRDLPEPKLDNQ